MGHVDTTNAQADLTIEPAVSVALVTWNSSRTLPRCLAALAAQTRPDFEVIVVDNASTDLPVEELVRDFPGLSLRLVPLSENRGFAAANNLAATMARGEWLATLNPDAFPEPGWLAALLDANRRRPEFASFASRQLQDGDPGRIDGEGDVYHTSGLVWRRHHGLPADPGSPEGEVFSACGAAALHRRSDFLAAGGFDESYFCYLEDVDLGFRLRLRGLRCLYVPAAVVRHIGSAGTGRRSDFAIFHGHRNLEWTFMKNMPAILFWAYLPLHLATTALMVAWYTLRGQPGAIIRSKVAALRGLGPIWRARRAIQAKRVARASEIRKALSRGLWSAVRAALQRL